MNLDVTSAQLIEQGFKRVKFTGSTALVQGMALCYDADRGTAGEADGERFRFVELPAVGNNDRFAGVVAQSYSAKTGGRWISIVPPGAAAFIALASNTVVDTTYLNFIVGGSDAGRWSNHCPGFSGKGRALALQTVTAQLAGQAAGVGSLSADGLTLTGTGFTAAPAVKAGDKVVVLQGEDDDTNTANAGEYIVASVTSNTVLVLTSSATAGAAGVMLCSYYVRRGNPVALAMLEDGEQSGGIYFLPLSTGGAITGNPVTGMMIIMGASTPSADMTDAAADGTAMGQRKGWFCDGTIGTNDYLITQVSPGLLSAGTTLSTIELDAADDIYTCSWSGGSGGTWSFLHKVGAAEA